MLRCSIDYRELRKLPKEDEIMVHYCCNRPDMVVGSIFDEDILAKKAAIVPDMSKCERPCRLTGANIQMRAERDQEINFI